jgi:peptide/nickel transport system substrate-binding protein
VKGRLRLSGWALGLIAVLVVTACSGGGKGSGGARAPTGGDGAGQIPAGTTEIAIASGADPVSLDPRRTWVGPGYSINAHIFEPLVFRQIEGDQVKLVGVLAETFANVDPVTWKFTLRKGVKFHNGKPLTAEAVKFTFESILDQNFVTPLKTWLSDVESVTAESELVVVVKTKYPTRGLLSSLAQVPIVEPGAVKELGEQFGTNPVGTGPYKVVKYTPNSSVVVERFGDYWGKPGKPDRITFRIMPENAVRLAALQAGEVVLAEGLPPDKMATVKKDANLDVKFTKTLRVDYLILENDRPWLKDVKFRKALSLAIDRKALVDSILGGTTVVASSVSPPGTIGFDTSLKPFEYDLAKAKSLLAETGYDGSPLKMGAPIGRYAMDKQVGEAIAGMLKKAGVNVQFEALEWSAYIPKTANAYDMWFIGQTDFTTNPNKHYDNLFYSKTSEIAYNNPAIDKLMDTAIQTLDDNAAADLYKQIQRTLYEEQPVLPLYYEPQLIAVRKDLEGFVPRLDEYVIVRDAELKK